MSKAWIYINRRKKIKAKICDNPLTLGTGLMLTTRDIGAILIQPKKRKARLHNLFVFKRLRAALLDEHNKVIEIIEMKPFYFYKSKKETRIIIELPERIKIRIGDKITWKKI